MYNPYERYNQSDVSIHAFLYAISINLSDNLERCSSDLFPKAAVERIEKDNTPLTTIRSHVSQQCHRLWIIIVPGHGFGSSSDDSKFEREFNPTFGSSPPNPILRWRTGLSGFSVQLTRTHNSNLKWFYCFQ